MSTTATTWVVIFAVAAFAAAMIVVPCLQGGLIAREERPLPTGSAGLRRPLWVCAEPPVRFTVEQAHREMQLHRHHLAEDCPRKAAAFRVLVQEGHATPDTGRIRVEA